MYSAALREVFTTEIRNKKKRKREFAAKIKNPLKLKIAFLCGSSPGEIPDYLEIFLLERGIEPEFYIGGYNRFYEDAVFGMEEFAPDIVYFHVTYHNIAAMPNLTDTAESVALKISEEFSRLKEMWETVRKRFSCTIIQNNFGYPPHRALGNLDGSDSRGFVCYIRELNERINEYAGKTQGFIVLDINYLSAREGLSEWENPLYMHLYKYAISAKCMPVLAYNLATVIASAYGKRKKCIVLDLDDTLWGGIVGEVGVSGIKAGADSPEGEAFSAFQKYLKRLTETGVLLAVASKNEQAAALSGFGAEGMVLAPEDFAAIYANWKPKYENIASIAKELNIGLDSIVFIDDNPAERELVKSFLPEVSVIESSEPVGFLRELDKSGFFELVSLTGDDVNRTAMYRENAARASARAEFKDYGEYLKALSMSCVFEPVCAENAGRAAALVNKTNQFNLTYVKLTETGVLQAASGDSITVCGRLSDKFGDNGLVTVFIGQVNSETLTVTQWVMSCRVFGRELEYAVFDEVVRLCGGRGVRRIVGVFKPTLKNKPFERLYETLGFVPLNEKDGGEYEWIYELPSEPEQYKNKNTAIEIRRKEHDRV